MTRMTQAGARLLLWGVVVVISLTADAGHAQQPAATLPALPNPVATPAPASDPPAAETPAAPVPSAELPTAEEASTERPDENPLPPREQTIYIPYDEFREIFEKPGRGVFLPYEQFQKLWQAARARRPIDRPAEAPVGALIKSISSQAEVLQDVVRVQADLEVELLREGWHEVPLRLPDAAVRSARINGRAARVLFDAEQGHRLLLKHDSAEARSLRVELEYAKAFAKSPAQNSVAFAAPQAPVNRWRITVPESGVKIDIQPLIAATQEDPQATATTPDDPPATEDDTPQEAPATANRTVILAFVGAAPEVRISWTPKSEGAAGLKAIANVTSEQQVLLDEGVVRTRARLDYAISRAELESFGIEIPADQRVTGVFDANVKRWNVTTEGQLQTITVDLYQPARGSQSLSIEMERFFEGGLPESVTVPVIRALDVSRQQGLIVVRTGPELQIDAVERSGLLQVDTSELPAALKRTSWSLAYRFSAVPFELSVAASPIRPRIDVDLLAECYLERQQLTQEVFALLDIQQAGVFQLDFQVPAGSEIQAVRGQAAAGAAAAAVDTYHRNGDRLVVNLARKAQQRIGLVIHLRRDLDELAALTPGEDELLLALSIPRLLTAAESAGGRVVVYARDSLRVNPQQTSNLRSVSFEEAFADTVSLRENRYPGLRPMLAYRYREGAIDLSLRVQRRRPHISVRQLLTARVESGVVKYTATFFYEIRYSGVKTLRIDLPQDHADEIRNVTSGVRERRLEPQPDDVAEGYVAWEFAGETEFQGQSQLNLQWEIENEELEVGATTEVVLPRLEPRNVDRAWGQVVLTKAEAIDLQPGSEASGLRPIDPQLDLMAGAQVPDAARAFEFYDQWTLPLTATRFQLEEIKRTSVERGLVRCVVTRSGRVSVQALYRVRSAVQRLAVQLPADVEFDADPLRVDGQPRALERGENEALYIPLSESPDAAVLVELRYTIPGNHQRLSPPTFPAQPPVQTAPAVQKVYLSAYLADDLVLLGSQGPWTREADLWQLRLLPTPAPPDDHDLVAWVREETQASKNQLVSFPTDGNLYLYSTLRPPPPPNGDLRLVAVSRRLVDSLLFGCLGLVALVFVRRSLRIKTMVVLLLVVAVIVAGIFIPTFTQHVVDGRFLVAFGVVALLWLAASIVLAGMRAPAIASPTPAAEVVEGPPTELPTEPPTGPPTEPPTGANGESPFESIEADEASEPEPNDDEPKDQGGENHAS